MLKLLEFSRQYLPDFFNRDIKSFDDPQGFIFWVCFIIIFLFIVFWRYIDRKEPEPKKIYIVLFLSGILLVYWVVAPINSFFASIAPLPILAVFIGPAAEEITKASIILLFVYGLKSCNQIKDGFIYGIVLAGGFSLIESYSKLAHEVEKLSQIPIILWIALIIFFFLKLTMLHAMASGIFGYLAARGKLLKHKLDPILGLFIAITLHVITNSLIIIWDLGYLPLGINLIILFTMLYVLSRPASNRVYT